MNPLMNKQGQQFARTQTANPLQMLGQFMKNPVDALRQAGYDVPEGMTDPRQITNHLISNGQLNNSKLMQLQKMAQMLPRSR